VKIGWSERAKADEKKSAEANFLTYETFSGFFTYHLSATFTSSSNFIYRDYRVGRKYIFGWLKAYFTDTDQFDLPVHCDENKIEKFAKRNQV
jgi:hypothetical protein